MRGDQDYNFVGMARHTLGKNVEHQKWKQEQNSNNKRARRRGSYDVVTAPGQRYASIRRKAGGGETYSAGCNATVN